MTRPFSGLTLEWTEQATRQLDQAHDYIALANSEEVADRITTRIVSTTQQLVAFPMSGRTGRVPGTRELVIPNTPFIAAYAIDHDRIVVLAIYHGAQRWPDVF
ncbi:MAG: type II toxin-antitoxin system RelE/ParE family toxin [Terriglobales bacterium]